MSAIPLDVMICEKTINANKEGIMTDKQVYTERSDASMIFCASNTRTAHKAKAKTDAMTANVFVRFNIVLLFELYKGLFHIDYIKRKVI